LDHTITELQAQIDQLSLALHQWRSTQDHLEPMEQRLTELTERCAEILNRWTATDARHAQAVGQVEERLNEWNAIESRLQQDAGKRLRELEIVIENEWKALRQLHEEPVRQLREQAAELGETCRAAASLALQSFERAEKRIAQLETDLQGRLTRLSSDVAALAARTEPRGGQLPSPGPSPFPLDGVMRLHDELRASEGAPTAAMPAPAALAAPPPPAAPMQLAAPAELTRRLDTLEHEVATEREEVREAATRSARMRWQWRALFVALIAAVAFGGAYGLALQRRVTAQLDNAAARAAAAEREAQTTAAAASQEIAQARADADRQIAEARDAARLAQITSGVLAAPDLVRLTIVGTDPAATAVAYIHWSRSTGLVVNAARLPAVPAGSAYQVWMQGDPAHASAGFLTPDAAGRASLIAENPPDLPRPVTGVLVTIEPAGGSPSPSGPPILARAAVQ
jgi:hypothetical protein